MVSELTSQWPGDPVQFGCDSACDLSVWSKARNSFLPAFKTGVFFAFFPLNVPIQSAGSELIYS